MGAVSHMLVRMASGRFPGEAYVVGSTAWGHCSEAAPGPCTTLPCMHLVTAGV